VSLIGILQIVFIVLKLTNLITWSWVVVFMPLIIVMILWIIAIIVTAII